MDEYIDRYELTKNLCKAICGRDAGLCVAEPKDCYQKEMLAVFDTPAADVAPVVHGTWETHLLPLAWKCSACGFKNRFQSGRTTEYLNYCPRCGAKMDKEATDGLDTN